MDEHAAAQQVFVNPLPHTEPLLLSLWKHGARCSAFLAGGVPTLRIQMPLYGGLFPACLPAVYPLPLRSSHDHCGGRPAGKLLIYSEATPIEIGGFDFLATIYNIESTGR